jgi:predicted Rossmann-fold nucleotide-binding protein
VQVLITGSRDASPAMLAKAQQVAQWYAREGHTVLVGDAPGVDRAVRRACAREHVTCYVFGAYGRFRDIDVGSQVVNADFPEYLARDRYLATRCDLCIAIWNGRSRGTKYTFEYARRLGKRVIVRAFSKAVRP